MNSVRILLMVVLAARVLPGAAPNVVLITLDTTRQDALSCYGQKAMETPTLDRLAGVSHQFSNAYTPVPQTLPAHTSLLTGLDPFEHGVRDNFRGALGPSVPTLAGVLKAGGYQTSAVIAAVVLDRRFGLDQGIDAYDDAIRSAHGCRRAEEVTPLALRELKRLKPPYFLWVHYYDPHYPYDAPGRKDALPPYLGEVRHMDQQMAALVDRLDLGSTVVVVAGDHGELLGEHREVEHGVLLYEGAIQVPLLIHLPGQTERRLHARTVSLTSVFATVLDAVGAGNPSPRSHPSLLSASAPPPVYLETFYPYFSFHWSPLRGVIRDGHKLIVSTRGDEVYRLDRDPGELADLSGSEPGRRAQLKETLDGLCPEKSLLLPRSRAEQVPHDLRKQIESLGYLGGNDPAEGAGIAPGDLPHPRDVADIAHFVLRTVPRMLRGGQERALLSEAKQALKRDPYDVLLIDAVGTATMQLGDLDRARGIFLEGLKISPLMPSLLGSLGRCLLMMGRLDEAETHLRQALHADPFQPAHYAYLAQLYLGQKKDRLAQAVLEDARRQGMQTFGLTFVAGQLAMFRADYAEAVSAFETTLRLNPGMNDAVVNLALCHFQARDYARAWTAFQKALQIKPGDFRLTKLAFEVAVALDKRQEARALAAGFVAQYPMTEEARTMRKLFPDLP